MLARIMAQEKRLLHSDQLLSHIPIRAPYGMLLILKLLGILLLVFGKAEALNTCAWSTTGAAQPVLSSCTISSSNSTADYLNLYSKRDPGLWLPLDLRPPLGVHARLFDVNLQLPLCEPLWNLSARECSFLPSATWPSTGLQAGPAYLYYERLTGPTSTAQRLNISCPPGDWARLLAGSAQGLAPCGTATVASGPQLLAALQLLQPGHSRLLVTLAANISLPADATPQRLEAPTDGAQPLVSVYRNVTLAGAGGGSGTELDVRMRQNAFGLLDVSAGQQEQPEQGAGWRGGPVITLADVHIVNVPRGPPSSWPLGLLSLNHYYVGMNRSAAGVRLMLLRTRTVHTPGEFSYMSYWFGRMMSLNPEEQRSAAWLQALMRTMQYFADADGGHTSFNSIGSFMWSFNITITPTPLLTPASQPDFDLWSLSPSALISGSAAPLPPTSFEVVRDAAQLLALLQDAWTGGPRVGLLPANITLRAGEWPQDGANLSYNLTLLGPANGSPVWLDAGGMRLVLSSSGVPAVLQLQRLRLVGFLAPLLVADQGDVAEAAALGAFAGSQALGAWRDRCLGQSYNSSGTSATAAASVTIEVRNCTLEMSAASLLLLAASFNGSCGASGSSSSAAAAACKLVQMVRSSDDSGGLTLPRPLRTLLGRSLAGQVVSSPASSSAVLLASGRVGSVLLANSTAVATGGAAAPLAAVGSDVPACSVVSLLLLAQALLRQPLPPPPPAPSSPPPTSHHSAHKAVVAGSAAGGGAAGALCLLAAAVAAVRHHRRRRASTQRPPVKGSEAPLVGIAVSANGGTGHTDAGRGEGGAGVSYGGGGAMVVDSGAGGHGGFRHDEERLTFSTVQGSQAGSLAARGNALTMLDTVLLDGCWNAGGNNRMRCATGPRVARRSLDALATEVRAVVAEEIEQLARKCQAAAAVPVGGRTPRRLLGRGAHGAVYMGHWRGLPAAVKVVVMRPGDPARRREQLAREAAITSALIHPHVVPTYQFALGAVPEKTASSVLLGTAYLEDGDWLPDTGQTSADKAAAVCLRLAMQYCEGGSLRQALQAGPLSGNRGSRQRPQPPPRPQVPAAPSPQQGPLAADTLLAAAAWADPPPPPRTTRGPDAAAGPWGDPRMTWGCLRATPHMPLALLAALDMLRGLAFLHSRGIVHGDLTENNVLLKEVQPLLPPAPVSLPPLPLSPASSIGPASRAAAAAGGLHAALGAGPTLWRAQLHNGTVADTGGPGVAGGSGRLGNFLVPAAAEPACGAGRPGDSESVRLEILPEDEADEGHDAPHPHSGAGEVAPDLSRQECPRRPISPPPLAAPLPLALVSDIELQRLEPCTAHFGVGAAEGGTEVAAAVGAEAGMMAAALREISVRRSGGSDSGSDTGSRNGITGMLPEAAETASAPIANSAAVRGRPSTGDWALQSLTGSAALNDGSAPPPRASFDSSAPLPNLNTGDARNPPREPTSASARRQERVWSHRRTLGVGTPRDDRSAELAVPDLAATAERLLSYSFKIADFGLSVQLSDLAASHVSDMAQGTPFFAAPEVMMSGHMSPAADMYSFGVLLWLLMHGVSLGQLRHLLPATPCMPVWSLLLRHMAPDLPPAAAALLRSCLAERPTDRPAALEVKPRVRELLKEVCGPELCGLLLGAERREVVREAPSYPVNE
ncbi:hypothetical protein Agub_g2793 [Astrephomene gubernaculifera]|uniref:Protein kinase domain-containing protein n=1 Tax=Astrephomene gubernaculifera TaxID=47775 RepID=A0AAD3DHM3_9CHLO|nr:hypothetical protein Agub_g2793 [Astrephomene gubernaculifera]